MQLALPDKPSIAVLPFQNMSGDLEQEYFADWIVEDEMACANRQSFGSCLRQKELAGEVVSHGMGISVP
jgi:hypothetical protein